MGRTLTAKITAATEKRITNPVYLVRLGFSTTLRYSSHNEIEWSGETWSPLGIVVDSPSTHEARLELRNEDNSISALVLNEQLSMVSVDIYQYYDGDAVQIHKGVVDELVEVGARVVFTTISHSRAAEYPDERISGPKFGHITPSGTVIQWGNSTITLQPSRNNG